MMLGLAILLPWLGALALVVRPRGARPTALVFALTELLLMALVARAPLDGAVLHAHALPLPFLGRLWSLRSNRLGTLLALLTAFLLPATLVTAWRLAEFRALAIFVLLMTGTLIGLFFANNLLLFYLFYEVLALAGTFLIAATGDRDRAAALQFLLYTVVGSLLFLVAVVMIALVHGAQTGIYSFSRPALMDTTIAAPMALWLFLALIVGLAVKMPLFPLHSWAASAYGHAAPAASVFLSGAAVTAGAYGIVRFAIPLLPEAALRFLPAGVIIATTGTLYAALLALSAPNLRQFAAYASVSHMNLVALGILVLQTQAVAGGAFLLIAHGLVSAGLFAVIALLEARGVSGQWPQLGGLFRVTPKLGAGMLFFFLAGMGLPGLANFPGEFLTLIGAFQVLPWAAAAAALGIVISVVYFLRGYERVMLGPLNAQLPAGIADLGAREGLVLGILGLSTLWLGLDPQPIVAHLGTLLPPHVIARLGRGPHG